MYKISTESSISSKPWKVGLLQKKKFFLRNPLRKTSTNNINNRMGEVCCFNIIVF